MPKIIPSEHGYPVLTLALPRMRLPTTGTYF
jgi:hypothetical protein